MTPRTLKLLAAALGVAAFVYGALYISVLLAPLVFCFLIARRHVRRRSHGRPSAALTAAVAAGGAWLGMRPARKAIREADELTRRERDELCRLRAWWERTYGDVPF